MDVRESKGTLILLHGYGADEHDLMGLVPYFDENLQVLSIRAPGSTAFGGASWFDIGMHADGSLQFNAEQALSSAQGVIQLIETMRSTGTITEGQIILGGFSQGASISNLITLSSPKLIKGLLIMSGRLTEGIKALLKDAESLRGLPVFAGHGTQDEVIPIEFGRQIVSFWEALPVHLEHYEYAMGHEINQAELLHIQAWFERHLF